MRESETVRVCGMSSHLVFEIVMCCVIAFFFKFHLEPAQLSERKLKKQTKKLKGKKKNLELQDCSKSHEQLNDVCCAHSVQLLCELFKIS